MTKTASSSCPREHDKDPFMQEKNKRAQTEHYSHLQSSLGSPCCHYGQDPFGQEKEEEARESNQSFPNRHLAVTVALFSAAGVVAVVVEVCRVGTVQLITLTTAECLRQFWSGSLQ